LWRWARTFCVGNGQSEPAPSSAPWKKDGKWPGNNFLLGFSSQTNEGR
jgi:hypothetical protein